MRRLLVVALLLVVVGAVWYKLPALRKERGSGAPGSREKSSVPVELVTVARGDIEDVVSVVGEVAGARSAQVTPRVAGFLEEVLVRVGDPVSEGKTVLATLDAAEMVLEEQRSWAALRVAEATFEEKQAAYDEVTRQLQQERALFAQKVSSKESLDAAIFKERSARAARSLAQAGVERAQAELGLARMARERTRVLAPFDGVVAERFRDGGEQVTAATPLVALVDVRRVRVTGDITEVDFRRLRSFLGQGRPLPARVVVASSPDVYEGVVHAVAPVFDPASRTASVEVDLDNPTGALLPGMFARVTLVLRRVEKVLLTPVEAIVDRGDVPGVFVAADEKATFVRPRFGIRSRTHVQILEGLDEGALLVTTGNHLLTDGTKIAPVGPTAEAEPRPTPEKDAAVRPRVLTPSR